MVDEPLYKSLIDRYRVLMTDPSAAAQATGWFTQSAKQITGLSAAEIMGNPGDRKRLLPISKVDPRLTGRMVMFFYNPKHRVKLPHYDMFPMVIPIEFYPDDFLGLNHHYLPPSLRVRMLDQLYQIYKNRHLDEKKKLNIGDQMLNRSIRSRYFAPCVHRYLYTASNGGGIKSKLYLVAPEEWDAMLALPVERFMGNSKEAVWRKAREAIGQRNN